VNSRFLGLSVSVIGSAKFEACLLSLFCFALFFSCRVDDSLPEGQSPNTIEFTPRFAESARCIDSTDTCDDPNLCAASATGEPDGLAVNLRLCRSLEVIFLSGTLSVQNPSGGIPDADTFNPDFLVHLDMEEGGSIQVHALSRAGGADPILLGFIGEAPEAFGSQFIDQCIVPVRDGVAGIDLAACNPLTNITALRFSLTDSLSAKSVRIDAVEILSNSFKESTR